MSTASITTSLSHGGSQIRLSSSATVTVSDAEAYFSSFPLSTTPVKIEPNEINVQKMVFVKCLSGHYILLSVDDDVTWPIRINPGNGFSIFWSGTGVFAKIKSFGTSMVSVTIIPT